MAVYLTIIDTDKNIEVTEVCENFKMTRNEGSYNTFKREQGYTVEGTIKNKPFIVTTNTDNHIFEAKVNDQELTEEKAQKKFGQLFDSFPAA